MSNDTFLGVVNVLHEMFGNECDISIDTIADDVPGWDSLSHTLLIMLLKKKFPTVSNWSAQDFENVGDMVSFIDSQLTGK